MTIDTLAVHTLFTDHTSQLGTAIRAETRRYAIP